MTGGIVTASLAGRGTGPPSIAQSPTTTASATHQGTRVWTAAGEVIDNPETGPVFCTGVVFHSDPPSCGGLRLVGWDWGPFPDIKPERRVRTAFASIVGTYEPDPTDGGGPTFTLTRPPEPVTEVRNDNTEPTVDFRSPCPPPPGGWRIVQPPRMTSKHLEAIIRAAERLPNFGELWMDTRGGSVGFVLNVAVVGDTAAAERALRPLWGGGLCVSQATITRAQLQRLQQLIARDHQPVSSGIVRAGLEIGMVVDEDGQLQREFDERYGKGVVRVWTVLKPYRP